MQFGMWRNPKIDLPRPSVLSLVNNLIEMRGKICGSGKVKDGLALRK